MGKEKQVKKPYLAPKCEVIQMDAHNLLTISGSMGGFEDGGSLSKENWFDEEAEFPKDFDMGTGNTQTGKEEQL